MAVGKINGKMYKQMFINGAINLKNNQQEIDDLNVFPVPDGDTGTNMSMTMMSGLNEIRNDHETSFEAISKKISRGLLMGARGNSGVILSQLFRGIYLSVKNKNKFEVTSIEFAKSLIEGYKTAYKAVLEPVEGTILTVSREAAEYASSVNAKTIEEYLKAYIKEANESLKRTPDLLPVLKEANVVDSGAAGLIRVMEGMLAYLQGEVYELKEQQITPSSNNEFEGINVEDIKFQYCTEFIVLLSDIEKFSEKKLKTRLGGLGDSMVVVQDDDIVKVHIHTNEPGVVLTTAQYYGEFISLKVDNMKQQALQNGSYKDEKPFENFNEKVEDKKDLAVISVCLGEGIKEVFGEMGVDYIIDGGQTMNPPTEEFVEAIKKVNAENVIIIPNNSNVILSAEQAAELVNDINVRVLPAKTIPQGYVSMINFDITQSIDENIKEMSEALMNMSYAEITYSIRDTEINNVKIENGDFMGIKNGKISIAEKDRLDLTKKLLETMVNNDTEVVTLFIGEDVKDEEVDKLESFITKKYSNVEVDIIEGNQEIYSYFIAVE